jgi:hypothetical protein
MEKVIKIGKQEVKLSNNVAWTMEYRDQFGKDIVPALMPVLASMIEGVSTVVSDAGGSDINLTDIAGALQGRAMDVLLPMFQVEFVDTVINVTWAMAKAADESILPPKQWVRQFEEFPLDVVGPAVYDLVIRGFVSSKNLKRLKKIGKDLRNLQPSHSTTSSSQDSNED